MARRIKTAVIGCGMISNIYLKNLKNLFSVIDLMPIRNDSFTGKRMTFFFDLDGLPLELHE